MDKETYSRLAYGPPTAAINAYGSASEPPPNGRVSLLAMQVGESLEGLAKEVAELEQVLAPILSDVGPEAPIANSTQKMPPRCQLAVRLETTLDQIQRLIVVVQDVKRRIQL